MNTGLKITGVNTAQTINELSLKSWIEASSLELIAAKENCAQTSNHNIPFNALRYFSTQMHSLHQSTTAEPMLCHIAAERRRLVMGYNQS
jgi:hypothetical protein